MFSAFLYAGAKNIFSDLYWNWGLALSEKRSLDHPKRPYVAYFVLHCQ